MTGTAPAARATVDASLKTAETADGPRSRVRDSAPAVAPGQAAAETASPEAAPAASRPTAAPVAEAPAKAAARRTDATPKAARETTPANDASAAGPLPAADPSPAAEPASEVQVAEVEAAPAAAMTTNTPKARKRRPRAGGRSAAPAETEPSTPEAPAVTAESDPPPPAPAELPAPSAKATPSKAPEAVEPTTVADPPAEPLHVEAPGWPQPGELFDEAKAPAPEPARETSSYSSGYTVFSRRPTSHDHAPQAPAGDGFRPYRPVYEPGSQQADDASDAGLPSWLERAPAWDDDEGHAPEAADPRPKPRRISGRPRGASDDPRTARERAIAAKIRQALGDDELTPHFQRLVASALSEFAEDEPDPVAGG
jgi:hypothetical protein